MPATAVITGYATRNCLGNSVAETWTSLREGRRGLRAEEVVGGYTCPVGRLPGTSARTEPSFEPLLRTTLTAPPANWTWSDGGTAWLVCSAKGNVNALGTGEGDYGLSASARTIARELGATNEPICISTACTSSLAGIALATRLMQAGRYRRVAISGADVASPFVLSGFNRIQAISPTTCCPYDADRRGINLATAAATLFLEWREPRPGEICVAGVATSNDGFHISRPAPDGAGLRDCIERSSGAGLPDFICGHGTATILNDNMESEAVARSGLSAVPLFSVKGQLGHTLGACGVLETIVTARCLEEDIILPSVGFATPGTTADINVTRRAERKPLRRALNLAVGFGGGNAAIELIKA